MDTSNCFIAGFFIGGILGIIITIFLGSVDPTAMDVYQGKTTLKYEVVDGQVMDSVVIWKEDIYGNITK